MKTYKLYIRRYSILKNNYITDIRIIKTNDIYHEIGYIYCNSLEEIKRIDYEEIEFESKGNKYDKIFLEEVNE
jgi:hypothetical protein